MQAEKYFFKINHLLKTKLDIFFSETNFSTMNKHILGDKNREDIVFVAEHGKVWPTRLWQMLCLSGEKSIMPTKRSEGPAIISSSQGRCEANNFQLVASNFSANQADLEWKTINSTLSLHCRWLYDPETGVLNRRDRLTNTGAEAITIFRCLPRFVFPPNNYEVYLQQSRWGNENQGEWLKLHAGSITLESEWGRSTEGATPYACLRERDGHSGLAFHVIPHGNWIIRVTGRIFSNSLPIAVVEAGLSDADLRLILQPGAGFDLPEIIIQPLPDGAPEQAAPSLHCYFNKRVPLPRHNEIPVSYNTWFDRFDVLDVNHLRAQIKAAAEIGSEIFIVDAGWFGTGDGWDNVGDWREKTDRAFHGRMDSFADEVRANGMEFGLWMEPERYAADIPIRAKHPEWFVPGTSRIRMENPDARDYVAGEIARLIETYKLAWIKFDQNASRGYDDTGAELYNYYSAWYGILDDLRRKYPKTVFENCSSGAMCHDLSSLFHFDVHFPSDTVNPMDVLRISQGDLLRMPPGRILHWAVPRNTNLPAALIYPPGTHVLTPRAATWNTAETAEPDFLVIAAMYGALAFSGDLQSLEPQTRSRMRWYVDFYKQWRRLILTSVCHLLTPVRPLKDRADWTVLQLQSPETSASIIFHFYQPSNGKERCLIQLRNLDPATVYRVRRVNPDGQTEMNVPGDQLMRNGLELHEPYYMHAMYKAGITTVEPSN